MFKNRFFTLKESSAVTIYRSRWVKFRSIRC